MHPSSADDYWLTEAEFPGVVYTFSDNLVDKRKALADHVRLLLRHEVSLDSLKATQGSREIDLRLLLEESSGE